jgi:hypothetical protein
MLDGECFRKYFILFLGAAAARIAGEIMFQFVY